MTYISTANMSREEWLQRRMKSIGGSDAGAILGLCNDKYASPMTVWGDKTGRIPPKEDTEAMRLGWDLEDYVAQRWCEATGKKVQRWNRMIYNEQYPYSHADIDRKVVRENAGLECKTMSPDVAKAYDFESGEIPKQYYCQCVHYMAVTGFDRWYLAILVLGRGFYEFVIERDEDEIAALMAEENAFWEDYVLTDDPPPPDGFRATTDALEQIYAESEQLYAVLDDEKLYEYEELKNRYDECSRLLEQSKQAIMLDLADSENGSSESFEVEWKKRTRKSYDVKRFMKDHPEIDMTPYLKITEYRQFNVK